MYLLVEAPQNHESRCILFSRVYYNEVSNKLPNSIQFELLKYLEYLHTSFVLFTQRMVRVLYFVKNILPISRINKKKN